MFSTPLAQAPSPYQRYRPLPGWIFLPLIFLLPFVSGCLQSEAVLHLEGDGSGTIAMTLLVNEDMATMMTSASGEEGEPGPIMSDAELIAKGSQLGEGVRFVSSEPVESPGFKGVRALYEFDDVRKIRMEMSPSDGESATGKQEEPVTFDFTPAKNGVAQVVVHLPTQTSLEEGDENESPESAETPSEAEIAQMRTMFGGLRIAAKIETSGAIVKTNSPYQDGSMVTLLEMDFDQLLQDVNKLTELVSMGQPKDLGELTQRLQGIPGIKVNPTETITIDFKTK